jgi:hypothetical protein
MGSQELWEVPIAVPCNELRRHHVFVENAGERFGHAGQRVGFGEFGLDFLLGDCCGRKLARPLSRRPRTDDYSSL